MSSERLEGEQRALAFLQEMLSEAEFEQINEHGYLEVPSSSKEETIYRIPYGGGLIKVFKQEKYYGDERMIEVKQLCLQPVDYLPKADVVLMHKLLIEADKQEYLQKANEYPPSHEITRRDRQDHMIHEYWGDNIL